jgi:hypothetical protein
MKLLQNRTAAVMHNNIRFLVLALMIGMGLGSSRAQAQEPQPDMPAAEGDRPADAPAGSADSEIRSVEPVSDEAIHQNDIGDLVDRRTDAAIKRGLDWLKASQRQDGAWGGAEDTNCTAYTALSMISFMLNGHFPSEKQPYGPTLKRSLDYLLQDGKRSIKGFMGTNMYSHGLATLALSEAWGQTDRDDEVQESLKAAVGVILRSQAPIGGWRYNPVPGDADVSVTAMQLVALAAARQAGILVPNQTIDRAIRFIHLCRDESTGGFNYVAGAGRPALPRSAAATFSLMMCGRHASAEAKGGVRYLESLPAEKFEKCEFYAYAHYYAALVMSMAGEDHFRAWYPQIRNALLAHQAKTGSWAERPYETSMALIVLSIPYCYVPAYQR